MLNNIIVATINSIADSVVLIVVSPYGVIAVIIWTKPLFNHHIVSPDCFVLYTVGIA